MIDILSAALAVIGAFLVLWFLLATGATILNILDKD